MRAKKFSPLALLLAASAIGLIGALLYSKFGSSPLPWILSIAATTSILVAGVLIRDSYAENRRIYAELLALKSLTDLGVADRASESPTPSGILSRMRMSLIEAQGSRAYLNDILSSMREGLVVVDRAGIIFSSNRAALELFCRTEQELHGERLWHLFDPASTLHSLEGLFSEQAGGGSAEAKIYSANLNAEPEKFISLNWQPFLSSTHFSDKPLFIVTLMDISERKELETQLVHAQRMEALGQLAGGVAHDFNNILGGIAGSAEVLRRTLKHNELALRRVELIQRCVTQAADLTKKLLGFARKGQYEVRAILVEELFQEVAQLLENTISKDIAIELRVAPGTRAIIGDSAQLTAVLMNLALNARDALNGRGVIKFTASNLDISQQDSPVSELPSGNYVVIRVEDNGSGIKPTDLERIFEPFFSTKPVGQGSGLGLSMALGIVKNHGGALSASSTLGVGSAFDITIPASAVVLSETGITTVSDKCIDSDPYLALKGRRVLLVDDEPLVRESTAGFLEYSGLEVVLASNGENALDLVRAGEQRFDLIILDVVMPKKDGISTFTEIRKTNSEVPVIFYSGFAESDKIIECRRDPLVRFIEKPYLPEKFLDLISEVVGPRS